MIDANYYVQRICEYMGVKHEEVLSGSRKKLLVNARILISVVLTEKDYIQESIASLIGRERSAVSHNLKAFKDQVEISYEDFIEYNEFCEKLIAEKHIIEVDIRELPDGELLRVQRILAYTNLNGANDEAVKTITEEIERRV